MRPAEDATPVGLEQFGTPIPKTSQRGRHAANTYTVVANGKGVPAARCNGCGKTIPLKSNFGVVEEAWRILASHFHHAACPDPLCANHRVAALVETGCDAIRIDNPMGGMAWRRDAYVCLLEAVGNVRR